MIISTTSKREVIDITDRIEAELHGSGLANIFLRHTSAALMVADRDPGTDQDYLAAIASMSPRGRWVHPHDPAHFPDHMWAALFGPSLSVPYREGKLLLGSWQRVVLVELYGPREREVIIT